jgi:hypothetical protein
MIGFSFGNKKYNTSTKLFSSIGRILLAVGRLRLPHVLMLKKTLKRFCQDDVLSTKQQQNN